MSPRTRLILIFAGKVVGLLIAISVLWSFLIAMPYNRALVAVSDRASRADIILAADFDEEVRRENSLEEDYICIASRQPGEILLYGYIPGSALHYGMLLVISLIAATPALGWRRRLMFIPTAILIMFLLHLSTILIIAKVSLSGVNPLPAITLFITLGTALFPALVWSILCYKYWWPKAV